MKKKILFLFVGITLTQALWSQGITKHGEVPATSVIFVNKHGETGSIPKLSVNGKELNVGFICGNSMTINHVTSGGVALVDKTVVYGTVSTTLFGGTKCAITQNLGASNQAISATDNTEASGGWYWQFDRKQGYKVADDGTTRTPGSAWDHNPHTFPENWEASEDPCTLELGIGWRIPTMDEWAFADTNGLWSNYTDTYNSVLKLHAAGWLDYYDGELGSRGSVGSYWSSTQLGYGAHLFFTSGLSGMYLNMLSSGFSARCVKDLLPTVTTTAVTSIAMTTASSGGNATYVGENEITARGVCWSTTTGPTVALATKTTDGSGTATFTSSITGLTGSTLYYVRAYATNSLGTSYGNEVTFTTMFDCGTSFTKIHIAGNVAPVDKTVTYGTVTGIPGELTKCWITQNLGASNQATAVDDGTEASAGWYWQFNRKQGYKHDETTRIPSTAWDATNDNLSATWQADKDPCTIELGSVWRIPTYSEWYNIDYTGSWQSWYDPWGSGLKLHAAGYLNHDVGLLGDRGVTGNYWSSTQVDANNGRDMYFLNGSSSMDNNEKSNGLTIRCLKELLPTVTTTAVTAITKNTASSGGNVTYDGGSTITARGVCWSTTTGPTTALTTKTTDGTGTGSFTSAITGLAGGTLYYARAYATNSAGTSYGNEVSFTTSVLDIGVLYQGGTIAYILQPTDPGYSATEQHGLIAALADQSSGIEWITGGYTQTTRNNKTSTDLGTGQANTNFMKAQTGYTGGAAKVCDDYTNTETGTGVYSDWYLPSRDELAKLHAMNVLGFGGFGSNSYWSSSELYDNTAWNMYFNMGFNYGLKSSQHYVRAVRAF